MEEVTTQSRKGRSMRWGERKSSGYQFFTGRKEGKELKKKKRPLGKIEDLGRSGGPKEQKNPLENLRNNVRPAE